MFRLFGSSSRSPAVAIAAFLGAICLLGGATYTVGLTARHVFLAQEEEVVPIIAGSELDDIPALMRGNLPSVTTSRVTGVPRGLCKQRVNASWRGDPPSRLAYRKKPCTSFEAPDTASDGSSKQK